MLNHREKQCGVYQYGRRLYNILKKSNNVVFCYEEIVSLDEYHRALLIHSPDAVIFNYHNLTMQWLGGDNIVRSTPNFGLHHEGSKPYNIGFNDYIEVNAIPRPIFENIIVDYPLNATPVIGSFGFGFGHKNFGTIVKMVNDQFDKAIIRLHIPRAYYGDRNGEATAGVLPGCWNEMKNPNIKLEITHGFMDDYDLLNFLAVNDLNVFIYAETGNMGISSVIDYAISVRRPIAVNKTKMFRHINFVMPSICIEDRALPEIMREGWQLEQFRTQWSHDNIIKTIEDIVC